MAMSPELIPRNSRLGGREESDETDGSDPPAANRGRTAHWPKEIPVTGWWDILWRVVKRLRAENITLICGGMAMYALMSVFPALAAAVSIYGLFATPADAIKHVQTFAGVLPPGVWDIFNSQLQTITRHETKTLSIAAVLGVVIAFWSARSAMSALMSGTNIAYGEAEKRKFFVQVLTSLVLTVGAVLGFLVMLLLGIVIPVTLNLLGTNSWVQWMADALQWALLWVFTAFALALVYRYGPARQRALWHWVKWGSLIAATLWLAMSAVFAFYVQAFANYGKTYGALGGVIVLLMWFYLSSVIVVLGAQINAEMERQTRVDTTEGPPAPMGQRGAYAADTLGPSVTGGGSENRT
jgi:membrane protein